VSAENLRRASDDAWAAIVALRTLPGLMDYEIEQLSDGRSREDVAGSWRASLRRAMAERREARTELRTARLVEEARRVAGLIGSACGELTARAAIVAGRREELSEDGPVPGMNLMMDSVTLGRAEDDVDAVADAAMDAFTTAHDTRAAEFAGRRTVPMIAPG